MRTLKTKPFDYFVGIKTLEELVTKDSKVCVINILGNESKKVTPVSHEYSGGNIVAGVQYGRYGKLETKIGDIPVYPSVKQVIKHGHYFDIGVIYLPPSAVFQAVSELLIYNENLKRIIILTEKVSVKDSREIRAICQEAGVDVIGGNCLGVANVWDHVRVGGALAGDKPEETLIKGSIAIHSNSGNFTTTIAEYLKTAGFGTSTVVSSGKDVYIHFAVPEFLYAAENDPRTKAVVLYVEPGGYYEKMALDMIKSGLIKFTKPIVVCVTGRWKKNVQRACGHAGALAGSGDDAESKEKWFDEYFGVGVFDPKNPIVSEKGVRVTSIQNIPDAMKYIFQKLNIKPDFEPIGDLSLKPWLTDKFISLPAELNIPVVKAIHPYDEQIKEMNKLVGAQYLRQNMMDKSGASRMNPATDVSELHGKSVLELSKYSIEENIYFALAKVMPDKDDKHTINMLLNLFLKMDKSRMDIVEIGRNNAASPNAYIASLIALIGNKKLLQKAREHARFIIDLIREHEIDEDTKFYPPEIRKTIIDELLTNEPQQESEVSKILYKEITKSTKKCTALQMCQYIIKIAEENNLYIKDTYEFLLASVCVCILWKPMMEKRITKQLVEDSLSYFYIIARIYAYSCINPKENIYWQKLTDTDKISNLTADFTENAFKILFNREPNAQELFEFKTLIGLTITNGPGTLSAKGAKESVSARNHISMSFVGFLSNTGFAHGGNGFEAVEFLINTFKDANLDDPGNNKHNINLKELANKKALEYAEYKKKEKETGTLNYKRIPCINHPVFKGNDVNIDPREQYVSEEMKKLNIYNVFLDFYHNLVRELYNEGVTKNVFCVNVDAVLAVITLKLVWNDLQEGKITLKDVQDIVFTLFLYGRAIGVAAEIADHRDRGLDMDCRTPQSQVQFVL